MCKPNATAYYTRFICFSEQSSRAESATADGGVGSSFMDSSALLGEDSGSAENVNVAGLQDE